MTRVAHLHKYEYCWRVVRHVAARWRYATGAAFQSAVTVTAQAACVVLPHPTTEFLQQCKRLLYHSMDCACYSP